MPTDRALQRRKKAIETLRQLRERDPKFKELMKAFFQRLNFVPIDVDNNDEGKHRCDFLLTIPLHDGDVLLGVQLKARKNIKDAGEVDKKILPSARTALACPHERRGKVLRLGKYYWITTGFVDPSNDHNIRARLNSEAFLADRVILWDAEQLVDEIYQSGNGDLLDEDLELNRLEDLAEKHQGDGEGVFAAHYWRVWFSS